MRFVAGIGIIGTFMVSCRIMQYLVLLFALSALIYDSRHFEVRTSLVFLEVMSKWQRMLEWGCGIAWSVKC